MNARFQAAIGEAMLRLRTADVSGATALLQRALSGRAAPSPATPTRSDTPSEGLQPRRRGLGSILLRLKQEKNLFKSATRLRAPEHPVPNDTARFRTRQFQSPAGAVTYKIYTPSDLADRELALVVMLHGCTQNPDDFAQGTRMNALADEFGLIVLYPHQPRSANGQGCWNWFDPRHQKRGSGEPGVLAGLAQQVAAEFDISSSRIFAAGLSAGGAMADILAETYPDVFSAVGIHSGLAHGAASDVMSAFAAMKGKARRGTGKIGGSRKIVFHGTADATVKPSNGDMVFDQARSAHAQRPEMRTQGVFNGKRVTRTVISQEDGPTLAEHWLVHTAGHAWSGGDSKGSFADAAGPDASREMIRFFLSHREAL